MHKQGSRVRLVTLDIVVMILKNLVTRPDGGVSLEDGHFAEIEGIREESTLLLRNFYKVRLVRAGIFPPLICGTN